MRTLTVLHLKQTHKPPVFFTELPPLYYILVKREVVLSQLAVASSILKHRGSPVVVEGLGVTLEHEADNEIKKIFPNGWVDKIEALTPPQIDLIYQYGAAWILLHLGVINRLYRSFEYGSSLHIKQTEFLQNLNAKSDAELLLAGQQLQKEREETAIVSCVKVKPEAESESSSTVLLVFGADHDFLKYAGSHPKLDEGVELIIKEEACNTQRGAASTCLSESSSLIYYVIAYQLCSPLVKAAVACAERVKQLAENPAECQLQQFEENRDALLICMSEVLQKRNIALLVGMAALITGALCLTAIPTGVTCVSALILLCVSGVAFSKAHALSFNKSELSSRVESLQTAVNRLFKPPEHQVVETPASAPQAISPSK